MDFKEIRAELMYYKENSLWGMFNGDILRYNVIYYENKKHP